MWGRGNRLADEVRPFRPQAWGVASPGWLEVTVYGMALIGFANAVWMALG